MLMTVLRRPIANSILVLFTTIISTQMITTPAHSQSGGQPTELADPVAVDMGKQFFARACTYCHGKEGAGGKTPAFKGRKDFTSQYLIDVIENGRVNGSNISLPGKALYPQRNYPSWWLIFCRWRANRLNSRCVLVPGGVTRGGRTRNVARTYNRYEDIYRYAPNA